MILSKSTIPDTIMARIYVHTRKLLTVQKSSGGHHEVQVLWDTGKTTWKHIETLKEYYSISLEKYAKESLLLDTPV